jgi:hypothetical protein
MRTARSRTSGEYFGDACFVMMTPVSQEMGPPVNPVRFRIAPSMSADLVRSWDASGMASVYSPVLVRAICCFDSFWAIWWACAGCWRISGAGVLWP